MARFETDGGTAFVGPLAVVTEEGVVQVEVDGAAVAALAPLAGGAALADVIAAYNALLAALQPA